MATIALSKSSLQQQRDRLRLFERFLPSLELKRQQLTAEYKKAVQELTEAEQGVDQASRSLSALLPIVGSARMPLSGLVRIRHVEGPVGVQSRNFANTAIEKLGFQARLPLREGIARTYPWVAAQVEAARLTR